MKKLLLLVWALCPLLLFAQPLQLAVPGFSLDTLTGLSSAPFPPYTQMAMDPINQKIYFPVSDVIGQLYSADANGLVTFEVANFASLFFAGTSLNFYPFIASDLEYSNGFIYTQLASGTTSGDLVRINLTTDSTEYLYTTTNSLYESGLAIKNDSLIFISYSTFSGNILSQYNLNTGIETFLDTLIDPIYTLKYDPLSDILYLGTSAGIFTYQNGVTTSIFTANMGNSVFDFDACSGYAYWKDLNTASIRRIDLNTGTDTVFINGPFFTDVEDLIFGPSSKGGGRSLYFILDSVLVECSGFSGSDSIQADFTFAITGNSVNFQDSSFNASSWLWDFGDGNISTDQNPTHTYTNVGQYLVSLVASSSCNSDTISFLIDLCSPSTVPVAEFTPFSSGTTVLFNDSSTFAESWFWDFGDGNTSNAQSPTHTYATVGQYTVSLIVNNACGSDTLSILIDLCRLSDGPVAGFSFTQNGLDVTFQNASTNGMSYLWDFGNGDTSNQANPSTTFVSGFAYEVVLIVSNNCGNDTITQLVDLTWPLAINYPDLTDWTISPNPSNGLFRVEASFRSIQQEIKLSIFNPIGQLIHQQGFSSRQHINQQLHLPTLSQGLYLVRLSSEGGVVEKKMIIE